MQSGKAYRKVSSVSVFCLESRSEALSIYLMNNPPAYAGNIPDVSGKWPNSLFFGTGQGVHLFLRAWLTWWKVAHKPNQPTTPPPTPFATRNAWAFFWKILILDPKIWNPGNFFETDETLNYWIHTHTQVETYTHTYLHARTYKHTYTLTHTLSLSLFLSLFDTLNEPLTIFGPELIR